MWSLGVPPGAVLVTPDVSHGDRSPFLDYVVYMMIGYDGALSLRRLGSYPCQDRSLLQS